MSVRGSVFARSAVSVSVCLLRPAASRRRSGGLSTGQLQAGTVRQTTLPARKLLSSGTTDLHCRPQDPGTYHPQACHGARLLLHKLPSRDSRHPEQLAAAKLLSLPPPALPINRSEGGASRDVHQRTAYKKGSAGPGAARDQRNTRSG